MWPGRYALVASGKGTRRELRVKCSHVSAAGVRVAARMAVLVAVRQGPPLAPLVQLSKLGQKDQVLLGRV